MGTTYRDADRSMSGPAIPSAVPLGAPLLAGAEQPLDTIGDGYVVADLT